MPLPHDALAAHRHLVYGYALRLLGHEHDAADVAQEVLVRVWRHGEAVEPERLRAWILRVTRNACLDALRSRQSRLIHALPVSDLDDAPGHDSLLPDHASEAADFRRHVDAALQRLEEPYRSIVVLREIDGLPYQEIADVLELPLNTLKVYLHRGRRRLRELLSASLSVEDLVP